MLVDTHCHLDLDPLYPELAGIIAEAELAGVTRFVVPGVHPDGWERIAAVAGRFKGVYPAFGIHPMHADRADDSSLSRLAVLSSGGVAIGEIGLDPSYATSMERQERAFREQVRLAVSLGLPVLVHCRKAFQKTALILREERAWQVGGIMHAYSGSSEMAGEFIRLGFAIAVSGMVTRENAVRMRRVIRELPLDVLVLETDAPDMTPQHYKGKPNRPAYIVETLLAVASIKDITVMDAAQACHFRTLNALPALRAS